MRVKPKSPREAIQPDRAPEPPQRSRHARNPIVILINLVLSSAVILILAVGAGIYWGKQEFDAAGPLTEDKTVIISSGQGLGGIADTLERNGVITDGLVFNLGVRAYKNAARLKAGEYEFKAGSSMRDVMTDLVEGKAVVYSVTIPEGWSTAQVIRRLRENEILTGEITDIPPEGALLPETYTFTRGASRQQILNQMQAAQTKLLAEIWARRVEGLPVQTPDELVILASIVEKETARADERPRVAGVFVNRLNKSMPLQSDPTILYGLYGGEAWTTDRSAITRADLDKKTEYNTYQIRALPPGPIGNPGRAAMEAVSNPSRTKDLYFVADGTGGHIFAETYEQHQANVRKWREIERTRRAQQAGGNGAAASEAAPEAPAPEGAAPATQN